MANDSVNVKIGADTQELTAALQRMSQALTASLGGIEQRLSGLATSSDKASAAVKRSGDSANAATNGFKNLASTLRNAFAAYLSFEAVKGVARLADEAVLATARLENVTGSLQAAKEAQSGLFEIAQRLQAPYQELVGSFSRLLPAVKEIGGGTREAQALAEILVTTAKLSGASSAEASASAQQFAQALGSGVLQGDELKSILENNQTFARTLAGALGVSVGELKKLGEQGKLTSDVVGNALLSSYDKIQAQSANLPVTISGAFTKVQNSFSKFIEVANNAANGPFGAIANAIASISTGIDSFTNSLSTGGSALETFNSVVEAVTPVIDAIKGAFDKIVESLNGETAGAFQFISDQIIPAVVNAFDLLGTIISTVIDVAGNVIAAFGTATEGVWRAVMSILAAVGIEFKDKTEASSAAVGLLQTAIENFGKGFSVIVESVGLGLNVIATTFGTVMGGLVDLAVGTIKAIGQAFGGDFAGAAATFRNTLSNMRENAAKQFEGMVQDAVSAANRINAALSGAQAGGAAVDPAKAREAFNKAEKQAYGSGPKPQPLAVLQPPRRSGGGGGGGGGGGSKASAEDGMAKAQLAAQKAQLDAQLKQLRDSLKLEEDDLKRSLDRKLITSSEYFSRLQNIREKEFDAEIKAKRDQIAALEAEEKRAAKPADKIRLQGQIKALETEIQTIEQKRVAVSKEIAFQQENSVKALDKQKASLREQLANLTGFGKLEAVLDRIKQKFSELPAEIAGSADAQALQRAEEAQARIAALEEANAQKKEIAEARIQAQRAQGLITEGTAKERLQELERQLNAEKIKGLEIELERARLAGDGQLESSLNRQIELVKLRNDTLKEGAEEMRQFTDSLQSSIQSNVQGILNGTKSLKDGLKGIFNDIFQQINSMIAKKLSESITNMLMGGSNGGGGLFGNLFGGLFGGGGGGGGGGFGDFFGSLFGGFRASGGWTPSGKAYMVGEKGKELFVPHTSGTIIPHDQLSSMGGGSVNIVVNTPDANSFRRADTQIAKQYGRALNRAGRRNG